MYLAHRHSAAWHTICWEALTFTSLFSAYAWFSHHIFHPFSYLSLGLMVLCLQGILKHVMLFIGRYVHVEALWLSPFSPPCISVLTCEFIRLYTFLLITLRQWLGFILCALQCTPHFVCCCAVHMLPIMYSHRNKLPQRPCTWEVIHKYDYRML